MKNSVYRRLTASIFSINCLLYQPLLPRDQITFLLSRALKCTGTLIADCIEKIYNNSINESVFPTQWKLARVTPIFKEGDHQVALNFRPISILPVLSKLLERHVAVTLLTWLTKHNLLLNNQSSYRPNFSCITALIKLVDDLLSDIDKGSLNGLLLVDLRKAFDLINHDLLIEKLACYYLTESSLEWFRSYLENNLSSYAPVNVTPHPPPIPGKYGALAIKQYQTVIMPHIQGPLILFKPLPNVKNTPTVGPNFV